MITINLIFVLKIMSLIFLGLMMLAYMIATFTQTEKISFLVVIITFLFMGIPFIYILLN